MWYPVWVGVQACTFVSAYVCLGTDVEGDEGVSKAWETLKNASRLKRREEEAPRGQT